MNEPLSEQPSDREDDGSGSTDEGTDGSADGSLAVALGLILVLVAVGLLGWATGYWTLWSSWWSGESLEARSFLGWSVQSWGRLGKVVAFVGGLTVVADILGEARVREVGSEMQKLAERSERARSSGLVRLVTLPWVIWVSYGELLARTVAGTLTHPQSRRIILSVGLVLVAVGFQFDLLAS